MKLPRPQDVVPSFRVDLRPGKQLFGVLITLLIALAATFKTSFAANYTETFDSGAAPGWTVVSGNWAVSAGTGNSSADGAADIAVYSGGSWATDFVYHARIDNQYGSWGNLAGPVFNYQDANNYYAVVFAPVGQLLAPPQAYLQRVFNGTTTTIAQASYGGGGPNVWFDVDVMRSGTGTTVKVNGVTVFDNVSQSELGLGKIGLITNFTHAQFDNVVLTETNSTAPFSENFDDGIANGWTVASGTWAVDTGTYHSTGVGPTDIAVYNGGSWATGFTYHASVNNGFTNYGNLPGAVYNYQDAANYYAVKFAPLAGPGTERLAHLVKVINGATTEITAPYSGGDSHVWFDVDVIRSGTGTTVNVNGVTVFNNITQSELGAGKVGLITSFTDARFDNVSLSTGSDASPPTVAITSPASGATVSGTITVTASASDNVGVAGVQFRVDGISSGAEATTAPYSISWNTATAANGSHTLTAVARDAAGNLGTSAPVTVTVSNTAPITRSGPRFPRLGAYPIGSPHSYETAQFRDMALKYHVVIVNQWPGWQGGHGTLQFPTMASVMNDIRNRSTVGTKMFIYVNNDAISDPTASDDAYYPVWQKLNAESWWLYQNATTPPPVRSTFSNTQGTANNTNFGPSDTAGKNWIRWKADFDYGFNVVGDANNAPNPYVDGFFMDNVFWAPRVRGDWNRDGTTDCNGASNFQPCNATEASWLRDGYRSYFDYIRSIWRPGTPGAGGLQAGNIADWGDPNADIVVYDQLLDGGVMEGMIGETWSVETQNGFISMMQWYRKMIDACRAPKLVIFGHDNWVSGNYQDMRYGLASTLMDDAYFYINASGGGYDPSNLLWFEEFSFDLGYPIQPRQEAQWSQGVWRRDFDNGIVLVNPSGNGAKTVNLGGTFRKLSGTQPGNNGAIVTSVTLADRDGIILSR